MNRKRSWPLLAVFLLVAAFLVQCSDSQDDNSSSSSQNGREVAEGTEQLPSLPHQVHAATDSPTGQKLIADDVATGDSFGESVSLSGDTAVIGSPGDDYDDKGEYSGSAYIFIRAADGTWKQQAKLIAKQDYEYDFGYSVSLSGDTALIGLSDGFPFVFVRNGSNWTQQQKLTSKQGNGVISSSSVSISGDTALVGVPTCWEDDENGHSSSSGCAYMFVRNDSTWSLREMFTKPRLTISIFGSSSPIDPRPIGFGSSVSISGDTFFVGSESDSVYYLRGSWRLKNSPRTMARWANLLAARYPSAAIRPCLCT